MPSYRDGAPYLSSGPDESSARHGASVVAEVGGCPSQLGLAAITATGKHGDMTLYLVVSVDL